VADIQRDIPPLFCVLVSHTWYNYHMMIDMEQVKRMVEEAEKNQAAESLVFHLTKCYFAPINGCWKEQKTLSPVSKFHVEELIWTKLFIAAQVESFAKNLK